jgi:unsaturated rhamnogalacturonyl hydrolase
MSVYSKTNNAIPLTPRFPAIPAWFFLVVILFLPSPGIYAEEISPSNTIPWYQRIADYQIKCLGNTLAFAKNRGTVWNYETGIFLKSIYMAGEKTGRPGYFNYVKHIMDYFVNADGTINTYNPDDYNLDQINQGKLLLTLYTKTKEEKYKKAVFLLEHQLETQPRTAEGGFWHKKIYPHQIWLDGIYMAAPFYAEFAAIFNRPEGFDIAADQILLVARHARDPKTGLFYHAWDESKKQKWADSLTGCSSQFWGRGVGWYVMGIIDTLDYLPSDHPRREEIIALFRALIRDVTAVQDPETGLWYQVLNQGKRSGNYLEASASSMFVYAIAKGINRGFLDKKYIPAVTKAYAGIIRYLIKIDSAGSPHLTQICKTAGLGGKPYRNGSYAYYIGELRVTDDLKGIGPFIQASLEMEGLRK